MDRTEWRGFLELWSTEWVAAHRTGEDSPLDEDVARTGWLGFGPAAEADVVAAEARLGRRLPPSLREFLLVTDGWRDAGCFIYRLAGTAELEWLRDTDDRSWIDAWEDLVEDGPDDNDDGEIASEARVLARSLRLSLDGDAAVMLLDPEDVDDSGEWAGYWLSSWSGRGPERHDGFAPLMRDQWRGFHALRRPPGTTRDHWDAEVERARVAALAGGIDAPLAVLAEAKEFGSPRAEVLGLQMRMLLGDWECHLGGFHWHLEEFEDLLLGPLFAAEFLPLLVRHDAYAEGHAWRPLPRLLDSAPGPVRELIRDHRASAAEPGFRPVFGVPEFDAAVRAVADRLAARTVAGDEAWPELLAAMRLWRPLDESHIAPVALLADPVLSQMITPDRGRALLSVPRP